MHLQDIFDKRKSHRHYLPKPVPRDTVLEIIKSAQAAPNSCNLQLVDFVVIDDLELLKRLATDVSYKFSYSPCCIVVLNDSRFTVERNSSVMSAGMAVENILLKAEEFGLGTCPMAGFYKDEKIKKILNIPKHKDLLLLVSIGYVDQSFLGISKVPRIQLEHIVSFNSYKISNNIFSGGKLDLYYPADSIDYRKRIAPVYLDRFRLNTLNPKFYEKSAQHFLDVLNRYDFRSGKVLDVMSYDGLFLKELFKIIKKNEFDIHTSDYLDTVTSFLSSKFGIGKVKISDQNKIEVSEEYFDAASFIYQAEATPKMELLLEDLEGKIKKGGIIFIATHKNTFRKKIKRLLLRVVRFILHKKNNIYEGNAFYKIGPQKDIKKRALIDSLKNSELIEEWRHSDGQIITDYFVLKKK